MSTATAESLEEQAIDLAHDIAQVRRDLAGLIDDRDALVVRMVESGFTLSHCARLFGVTRMALEFASRKRRP